VSPSFVVTDIEGTTSPIAFVRDTLFPYARARLAAWVAANAGGAVLADVPGGAPGDKLATLLGWMDADRKETALKEIQGRIWEEGYADGSLKGALYPEVAAYLRAWSDGGVVLAVYSSGSVAAQRLLFGHSVAGDLLPVFRYFFDTRVGAKREAASYRHIAGELRAEPGTILFLSDAETELDAAREAGLLSFQLVRAADRTVASARHPHGPDFAAVARAFNLPEPA
jgi:enolase-phosphatase E1